MTEPTRAKAARRSRRSASQVFIAALVVFGIAASVLLLFSENIQWLRVGLVSALWAAIVGAFAMTKYRRESVADQTKAKDLQTVYELQLAREISARREYELGVEARVRSEVQIETSEVAALRAELAHLRNNLQMLFDGNLPTERVALRAEATRMQELGGGRNYDSYQPAPSGLYIPGRQGVPGTNGAEHGPVAADHAVDDPSRAGAVPGLATPYDEPVTAETSILFPDTPIGTEPPRGYGPDSGRVPPSRRPEPRVPGGGRRVPTPPRASGPSQDSNFPAYAGASSVGNPEPFVAAQPYDESAGPVDDFDAPPAPSYQEAVPEPRVDEDVAPVPVEPSTGSDSWDGYLPEPEPETAQSQGGWSNLDNAAVPDSDDPQPVADPQPVVDQESTDASSGNWDLPEPTPRRRRRAQPDSPENSGAHSNGRSVAEIMAGLQSGDSEPSERRHRRRAD